MSKHKLESLTGGSGVHVFLVLWKAARAAQAYAEKSILGAGDVRQRLRRARSPAAQRAASC